MQEPMRRLLAPATGTDGSEGVRMDWDDFLPPFAVGATITIVAFGMALKALLDVACDGPIPA